MQNYQGRPMRCVGSVIHAGRLAVQVDQTPVEVVAMFDGTEGLVEFTYNGVSVYVDVNAPIVAIAPSFSILEEYS